MSNFYYYIWSIGKEEDEKNIITYYTHLSKCKVCNIKDAIDELINSGDEIVSMICLESQDERTWKKMKV